MKKLILCIFLAITLTFIFAGCNGNEPLTMEQYESIELGASYEEVAKTLINTAEPEIIRLECQYMHDLTDKTRQVKSVYVLEFTDGLLTTKTQGGYFD